MKARRDMTRREFAGAMRRNGFKHAFLFWFQDTTGATPGHSFSGVFLKGGKLARRATIAHLIRQRKAAIERLQQEATA